LEGDIRTTVWLVAALCGLSTSVALAQGPSKVVDKTDAARWRIVIQGELTSLDEEIAGLKKNREAVEHHAKILSDLLAELQLISFSKAFEPKLAEVSASFTRVKKKPSRVTRLKFGGTADGVVEAFVEPLQTWTRKYLRGTGNPSLSADDRTYVRMLVGAVDIDLIGLAAQPAYKRLISQDEDADGIPGSYLQSLELRYEGGTRNAGTERNP
jgi:hypothetical protein